MVRRGADRSRSAALARGPEHQAGIGSEARQAGTGGCLVWREPRSLGRGLEYIRGGVLGPWAATPATAFPGAPASPLKGSAGAQLLNGQARPRSRSCLPAVGNDLGQARR